MHWYNTAVAKAGRIWARGARWKGGERGYQSSRVVANVNGLRASGAWKASGPWSGYSVVDPISGLHSSIVVERPPRVPRQGSSAARVSRPVRRPLRGGPGRPAAEQEGPGRRRHGRPEGGGGSDAPPLPCIRTQEQLKSLRLCRVPPGRVWPSRAAGPGGGVREHAPLRLPLSAAVRPPLLVSRADGEGGLSSETSGGRLSRVCRIQLEVSSLPGHPPFPSH